MKQPHHKFSYKVNLNAGSSENFKLWQRLKKEKSKIPFFLSNVDYLKAYKLYLLSVHPKWVQVIHIVDSEVQPRTTISQDVLNRFSVQLAFAKFLSKIKGKF